MRRPVFALVALAALLAIGVAACGSGSSGAGTAAPTARNTIVIKNFMFTPMRLTVPPGARVSVQNDDAATHTLTAAKHAFDTGDIAQHATPTFTAPTKPGAYTYVCNIHQHMQGTLTVK